MNLTKNTTGGHLNLRNPCRRTYNPDAMSGVDDVDPWPPYPAPSEESDAASDSGFRMLKLERQLEAQRRQMEIYQQQHVSILNTITELTTQMSVTVQQNANAVATPMYSFPPPLSPVPQR